MEASELRTIEQESGILCRAITADGGVRIVGVQLEEAARALWDAHGLSGLAAEIAAEGLVATAMMSAHIKGDERMTIQVQSEAPALSFFGEIGSKGAIRGRLKPSEVVSASRELTGVLLAIKSTEEREVYRGATSVSAQTISDALQDHLSDSVQVDGLLWTEGAAGILVERLPETAGGPALSLDDFQARYGPLRERSPVDLVEELLTGSLAGEEVVLLGLRSLYWSCRCSRERVLGMLRTLGPEAIATIIEEDGQAEVVCHFCNRPFAIGLEPLQALHAQLTTRGSET